MNDATFHMQRSLLSYEIPMPSDREFQRLSDFVYQHLGIVWDESKKDLAYTRLRKRLHQLGIKTFQEYCDYLLSEEGQLEIQVMINAVTTNKTEFYRERPQFEFLEKTYLPQLQEQKLFGKDRKIRIWSAACSSGEEPYTLAMLVSESLWPAGTLGWDIRILASDIDTKVLAKAQEGQYTLEGVSPIPSVLLKKYFLENGQHEERTYQVKDALKSLIHFRPINFLDKDYPINTKFDLIFCRNVLIYFDPKHQQIILRRLNEYLHEGGYLFLGGSEILRGLDGFRRLKHNIYQKGAPPGEQQHGQN